MYTMHTFIPIIILAEHACTIASALIFAEIYLHQSAELLLTCIQAQYKHNTPCIYMQAGMHSHPGGTENVSSVLLCSW